MGPYPGEPLGYGYLESCSDLELKHGGKNWVAWQMLLQNKGFTFLEVINDSDTCSDAVNVYLNIIYYTYVFFLKQDKMHQWLKAGHKHVAHHIAFTRYSATGQVLWWRSLGDVTRCLLWSCYLDQAGSIDPPKIEPKFFSLFPFTIMIISPFFLSPRMF